MPPRKSRPRRPAIGVSIVTYSAENPATRARSIAASEADLVADPTPIAELRKLGQ